MPCGRRYESSRTKQYKRKLLAEGGAVRLCKSYPREPVCDKLNKKELEELRKLKTKR